MPGRRLSLNLVASGMDLIWPFAATERERLQPVQANFS